MSPSLEESIAGAAAAVSAEGQSESEAAATAEAQSKLADLVGAKESDSKMKIIKEGVEIVDRGPVIYTQYSSRRVCFEDDTNLTVEKVSVNRYAIRGGGLDISLTALDFQDGTPLRDSEEGETGFNGYIFTGVTVESLLAVALDRLEYLNGCVMDSKNHDAIKAVREAMRQLDARTRDREERGVEGTDAT